MQARLTALIALALTPVILPGCLRGRGPAGDAGNLAAGRGAPVTALVAAGQAYLDAAEPNDAFIAFRRAVGMDAKSYEAQLGLAKACVELGSTARGLQAAEAAAALNPQAAEPLIAAGRICLTTRKPDQAEQYLRDAVTLDAGNAEAWRDLGQARLLQGSVKPATMALEKARDLDPNDAEVHARLGAVYAADGRFAKATDEYTQAVALDAKSAAYPKNLAWLLIQQDTDLDRARELALQSDQLERGDGDALLAAAVVLLRQGHIDDAIEELRQAIDQVDTNGDLYVFLAEACVQRGRRDDIETAVKALEYVRAMGLPPRRATQERIDSLIEAIKDGVRRYQITG